MTDDERTKYAGLISLRNTEVTLRWTRTQIFLFINSIGVPLVVTQQLQHEPGLWFRIAAGVTGLALTYIWHVTIQRASRWTRLWDAQLIFLEERPQDTPVRIFGGEALFSCLYSYGRQSWCQLYSGNEKGEQHG